MSETEYIEEINEEENGIIFKDVFPEDHKYLTFLKKVFRHEFRRWGFRRISIPSITSTDLYAQSGQAQFNEHTILDNYALKFDTSLSILDSYIRNEKKEEIQPVYYYYIDNLFEKDWGNLKQIYNIGWDIIGEKDPILDMECIFLLDRVFKAIWIEWKYSIRVNSVGLKKEQAKYCEALVDFYSDKKHLLSETSLKNLEENPMLLLNPENEDEEILLGQAPVMRKFLKKHSKLHLEKFEEFMEMVWLEYEYDNTFLWSRPYYTNTVWEMVENETWEILAHGWRYDTLSMDIDETLRKEIPATGFDTNVERLINLLKKSGISIRNKDQLDLFFVQLGDDAKKQVFPIAAEARKAWINTMTSLWTPSMKEQMLKAQRSGAEFVVIVGIMEARNWNWQLRNMKKGTQDEIKKDEIIDFIVSQIWKENLDFYSPVADLTIWEPIIEEEGEEEK